MYSKVQDEVFEGILTAALNEFIIEEMNSLPSDEEISKMYPAPKKLIKKYKKKVKERKYQLPLSLVYMKRVAVVFLIVVSVSFGVLATSEDVRAAIADTVVTWYDKFVQMDFSKSEKPLDTEKNGEMIDSIPEFSDLTIGYIPPEYVLASNSEDQYYREYIYTSDNGDYMLIGIYASTVTEIASDIELMEYTQIEINKNDAYILHNEAERTVSLIFGNSKYSVLITAVSEKDEMIKVAENIK